MQPIVRTASLPHGIRLPYADHGDSAGVPVLFLHGITDSWRSFEAVLPRLPPSIRAVALTQRGHGDADRPDTGYRPQDFADDVEAFLDVLGIERAVVVGHSMGGSVAQRFSIDHGDRVAGLVLVGARAAWHDHPDVAALIEQVAGGLSDPVDPRFVLEFQQSTLAQPVPPGWLEMAVAESLKLPARVWRSAFIQGVQQADLTAVLGGIRARTLLICGELDTLARDGQDVLLAGIEHSQLVCYPGTGHALHWEDPDRFAADVTAFVRSLGIDAGEPASRATAGCLPRIGGARQPVAAVNPS